MSSGAACVALAFTATGCGDKPLAQVASLGVESDGNSVRLIVPACAGDRVALVQMYTGPAATSGSHDVWAIESDAVSEPTHEFVVGRTPPGYRVTRPFGGALPGDDITAFASGPRLEPGASSIYGSPTFALAVFSTRDVRSGEVLYGRGHHGTRQEFEAHACPKQ